MAEAVQAVAGYFFSSVGVNRPGIVRVLENPGAGRVVPNADWFVQGTKREYFRSGFGRFPVVFEYAILRRDWTCGSWQDKRKKLRDRREGGRLASACKGSRNRLPFCVTVYKIPRLTKIWDFFKRRLHLCRNML